MIDKITIAVILLALSAIQGCSLFPEKKDPFEGIYWAQTDDDRIALCAKNGKCYTPSPKDMEYFKLQMCGPEQSEI